MLGPKNPAATAGTPSARPASNAPTWRRPGADP